MNSRTRLVTAVVTACSLLNHPGQPLAQWAVNGLPVATGYNSSQRDPQIISDEHGGAIIVWSDSRNLINLVVYAKRITPAGRVAPSWPVDGVPLAKGPGHGAQPVLVSDGAGGAIVAWYNSDPFGWHIYAQRITPDGAIAPGWPENGLRLSNAVGDEYLSFIVSDGQGGAIAVWHDYRGTSGDIYAQRVTGDGSIAPGWNPDGALVCGAPGEQVAPRAAVDGAGGAFVVWQDMRTDVRGDIYTQHVTSSGVIADGWPEEGLGVAVGWDASYPFDLPVIAPDDAGGAIIAWQDGRAPFETIGTHALRITGDGAIAEGWPDVGVLVGRPSYGPHSYPGIIADGHGGAFVTTESQGLHVQHLTAEGAVASPWPAAGVALCTQAREPVIVADGAGGGVVAWLDYRGGHYFLPDVYAQRFTADGRLLPAWPPDGVALCTDPAEQGALALCSDGTGGAIVTWHDHRNQFATVLDVYAARVLSRGFVPPLVPIDVMPRRSDNVINVGTRGSVPVAILSTASFDAGIIRPTSVTFAGAAAMAQKGSGAQPDLRDVNGDRVRDLSLRFETEQLDFGPQDSLGTLRGETWDGIAIEGSDRVLVVRRAPGQAGAERADATPDEVASACLVAKPNPSRGPSLTASFVLSSSGPAALELLDLAGRSLISRAVGSLGPGRHSVELKATRALASGVYWLRLTQGSQVHLARAAIVR
jgi:hypothetical protein